MQAGGRLLWFRVRTKKVLTGNRWESVHDVEVLPGLQTLTTESGADTQSQVVERWSPVFVVGDSGALAPFSAKVTGIFWLLYDTRPIELAAHLENSIPAGLPYGLFLTHGMASVVLLVEAPHPRADPLTLFPTRTSLRSIEQWTVHDGRVRNCAVLRDRLNEAVDPHVASASRSFPENTQQCILREIQDNDLVVQQGLSLASAYRPAFSKRLKDLLRRSEATIGEIRTAATSDPIPWDRLQAAAYSLGHLNSMMAYFVSQGLGGRPPLLEHLGLLPSYSLFGVATAYQATWEITHFIEEGFLRFDILSEIKSRYFSSAAADFRGDLFRPALDGMGASAKRADENAPGHVNLFSGRLGFHSSTWAVAAPVDTLHEASEPGWNLLTLSHEMLHVHVDHLLHFVLSPNPEKESTVSQNELYLKMARLALENASKTDMPIIDRIRQKIARYVLHSAGCRGNDSAPLSQLPHATGMLTFEVTDAEQFRDMLVAFWRRLTEYIVHVLDFYYFYSGDVDRFVSLVLPSWAAIPSVYDDIGHYIMRCLLTVSTKEMEPDTGTGLVQPLDFEASLQTFYDAIEKVPASGSCCYFVSRIRKFLVNSENREFLRWEFIRARPLVWTTVMYFYCRPLRLYFEVGREVRGGILDDGALCPEFEVGAVQERLPLSPIAFLTKYLSRDYAESEGLDDVSMEAAAIWLFSWTASCGSSEGGKNAAGE